MAVVEWAVLSVENVDIFPIINTNLQLQIPYRILLIAESSQNALDAKDVIVVVSRAEVFNLCIIR